MLIGISSPYRRMGLIHNKFTQHYGVDGDDVLVVKGASKVFNATLDEAAIAAQRLADPTAARSESEMTPMPRASLHPALHPSGRFDSTSLPIKALELATG